jgi:predicted deacylase
MHGGIHGDEYEGPEAILRVMGEFDAAASTGTVIAVPFVNPSALEFGTRKGSFDQGDLNRFFPGKTTGYFSDQLCKVIIDDFVSRADYLIDIHSNGENLMHLPHVLYVKDTSAAAQQSLALAKVYGIPYLHGGPAWPNVIRMEAVRRGIPAITPEIGGEGRLREAETLMNVRGIRNVMRHVGILEGDADDLPERYTLIESHPSGEYANSRTGGLLRTRVQLGDTVEEGEVLGVLVNPLGEVVEEIRALHAGIVMGMRTKPHTLPGDWTYFVGKVTGSSEAGGARR